MASHSALQHKICKTYLHKSLTNGTLTASQKTTGNIKPLITWPLWLHNQGFVLTSFCLEVQHQV